MLEKHNNSKINNILGITLCTVLLVFALTKAPQSIAIEPAKDMKVGFSFDEIPLKQILELIFDANPKDVIGYENVPDLNISFEAWNVSAIQIERLILKCSGLKLVPKADKFEIIKDLKFNNDYSQLDECVQIQSNKEEMSKETIETIKKRNTQFREYLKKEGLETPAPNTLPFEEDKT